MQQEDLVSYFHISVRELVTFPFRHQTPPDGHKHTPDVAQFQTRWRPEKFRKTWIWILRSLVKGSLWGEGHHSVGTATEEVMFHMHMNLAWPVLVLLLLNILRLHECTNSGRGEVIMKDGGHNLTDITPKPPYMGNWLMSWANCFATNAELQPCCGDCSLNGFQNWQDEFSRWRD